MMFALKYPTRYLPVQVPLPPPPRQNHPLLGTRGETREGSRQSIPCHFSGWKGISMPITARAPLSHSLLCPSYVHLTIKGPRLPLLPHARERRRPNLSTTQNRWLDGQMAPSPKQAETDKVRPGRGRGDRWNCGRGGPRSPGPRHQAWEERRQTPGARNLTNKRLVPTTREGATVRTGMTETHRDDEEGRAVNDTRQKAPAPRPGTEGQGPPTLRNPTGWHHVSSLRAGWHWSQERGKEEKDAESFLQDDGEDAGILALRFPGGAGQPGQAAGQQTHASLQCEALKLWHLCRAQCQAPGRAPRMTFCKSLVNTKGGRSRRQEREGRNEVALRGTSLS